MKNSISRWLTICCAVILAWTLIFSAGWNYYSTRQAIRYWEEQETKSCADDVFSMLAQYSANDLQNASEKSFYPRLRSSVCRLSLAFNQDYLTIYLIDPETHLWTRVLAVASDEEEDDRLQSLGSGQITPDDTQSAAEKALFSEETDVYRREIDNAVFWYLADRQKPGPDNAVVCIEYSISMESSLVFRDFLLDSVPVVLALILGHLLLLILVRRRIIRPVRLISDRMKQFAHDSRHKVDPLPIRSEDEIGEIAGSFEKMTEDISTYINHIEALTKEQVETNVQLDVARGIQNGLVPEKTGLEGHACRVSAMTRPAKAVGGDFYDCFRRDERSVCIVMGDVSGKGISAAIFMAVAKTMLREKLMAGLSPAEALNRTNEGLYAQNPEGLFATVFAGIFDEQTGELSYANAGHTLPILLKSAPSYLKPDSGLILGLFEETQIRDEKLKLSCHEGILLYTDGVTEAVNPQNSFFGTDRLLEAVTALPFGSYTPEETVSQISRAVGAFCSGAEPFDDMAVLVLLRDGTEPELQRENSSLEHLDETAASESKPDGITPELAWQELPVDPASFEEMKKTVFEIAGDTPNTRKALLACDEALANIVHYSGAKNLTFSCERQDDRLCVILSDDGIPFDPSAVPEKTPALEMMDRGGMGLSLIRQTAAAMSYDRKDGRNELTMLFYLK